MLQGWVLMSNIHFEYRLALELQIVAEILSKPFGISNQGQPIKLKHRGSHQKTKKLPRK